MRAEAEREHASGRFNSSRKYIHRPEGRTMKRANIDVDTADRQRPASRKRALVLTADQFEDMEVYFPIFRLREEGWDVTVAAPTMRAIYGEHGYGLEPDATIEEINPDEFDLLLIPGGSPDGAPATVRNIKKAQEIATSFFSKDKPVGAICHGPYTLISAGLVKNRRLTSCWHDGLPEEIRSGGGVWQDEEVVVDGNLVSSLWPMDLPAFMRELIHVAEARA
jgi:protease I